MRPRRERPGVTVIELIVVVALVGIMASVVAPGFAPWDKPTTTEALTARVDALVRSARATAIDRAERVELTIDPTTGQFWLEPPDTSGILALPEGTTLISRGSRVHLHIETTGETSIDEALLVRQGDRTTSIVIGR